VPFDLNNAQSYIPSFTDLFTKYSVRRVLEFGEGDGTRFLLDNSEFVCSVEVIAYPYHKSWAVKCASMYSDEAGTGKWIQLLFTCSDKLIEVDQLCQKGIQSNTDLYTVELQSFLNQALKCGPFDVAFVDYGIHVRGDMVNLLFNKVGIIAAHDTNVSPGMYGWDKIDVPVNYTRVTFKQEYLGTTFWIKNDLLPGVAHEI
jgi:hypothetical protein